MKREHIFFIKDILDAIEKIEQFVGDMGFEEFVQDDKTSSAVVRKLEIIGEATKNTTLTIRKKYSMLPWSSMAKMRDRLVHGYFVVDHEIVWKVIKEELPA
ncbi:MAG: DUF86 domain-containing protein [Candidatus Thermoplasmatota archaeon]|nr:DUF86 domain-containing protein [Candidatus Thermoplasmatota archaeon]